MGLIHHITLTVSLIWAVLFRVFPAVAESVLSATPTAQTTVLRDTHKTHPLPDSAVYLVQDKDEQTSLRVNADFLPSLPVALPGLLMALVLLQPFCGFRLLNGWDYPGRITCYSARYASLRFKFSGLILPRFFPILYRHPAQYALKTYIPFIMKRILLFVLGCLVSIPMVSLAQSDTLRLTLAQAEAQFRQNNLQLMATKLGINENQAYEFQAKLWNNPSLYVEQMPYNAQTKEVMPLRQRNSEQVVQVQQLLLLAGKRNKQLAIARTNTELANDRFYDLLRTLNYQLRTTFYDLYYTQQALQVYEQETGTLRQTVSLFQQQYDKGNVPLKDLTRLKAYLFNLTSERQQLLRKLTDDQADLAVLLNASPSLTLQPMLENTEAVQPAVGQLNLNELVKTAEENRYDLKAFRDQAIQEKQNLALQKALAVPDLSVQATYDRNAGYIPNYVGVGVGINLPVFNKNQGNIKAATIRAQSSQQATDAYTIQVESDVQRAFRKVQQTDQVYRTFDQKFNGDFSRLIEGVTTNYRKQNIDVVEFLDFFDSFKSSQIQYNQLQNDRMQSLEELNFAVGTTLFTK